jgi:hypothetical protein
MLISRLAVTTASANTSATADNGVLRPTSAMYH